MHNVLDQQRVKQKTGHNDNTSMVNKESSESSQLIFDCIGSNNFGNL